MLELPVLNPEPEDSPRTVPAGERPQKKRGWEFYSRDVRVLFGRFSVNEELFYWYGSCGFLLVALREPDL